jgi:hypothetical protein
VADAKRGGTSSERSSSPSTEDGASSDTKGVSIPFAWSLPTSEPLPYRELAEAEGRMSVWQMSGTIPTPMFSPAQDATTHTTETEPECDDTDEDDDDDEDDEDDEDYTAWCGPYPAGGGW